jgi:hypothetical protein
VYLEFSIIFEKRFFMPTKEYIKNTVLKLRAVCREKELSSNDVYNMVTAEYGRQEVSRSSIIRLLKEDTDPSGFNFDLTVKPVSDLLLGIIEDSEDNGDNDEFDESKAKEYYLARNALQEVARLKGAEVERLRTQLEVIERESDEELKLITEYQAKSIAILEQNNAFLQQTIEVVRQSLHEERESKKRLYADLKERMTQIDEITARIAALEAYHKKD